MLKQVFLNIGVPCLTPNVQSRFVNRLGSEASV